jgi:broad specificity phosphatase PhoE
MEHLNSAPQRDSDLVVLFETHATSVDNEAGLASGWFDAPLSATGEAQARDLGVRRQSDDFRAVFCSDLSRAVRTAEIAFMDRRVSIVRDRRLRECNYGALTRIAATEIEARRAAHVETPFPQGESYRDVAERVRAWLAEVALTLDGDTLLVIGHRATFYALEHLMGNVPLNEAVSSPWQWQPGWQYRLPSTVNRRPSSVDRLPPTS